MSGKIIQTAGRNQLGDFAPDFAHFNDDVLFGENWNNQDIDLKTRSIITFVALMSSGITDSSLTYHLQNAKSNGVTKVTRPLSSRQHKKQKRSPKYPKAVCAICAGCFLLVVVGKPLSQRGAKRRTEKGACRGARPVTQYTLHGIP